jgi:hypothetical protein
MEHYAHIDAMDARQGEEEEEERERIRDDYEERLLTPGAVESGITAVLGGGGRAHARVGWPP